MCLVNCEREPIRGSPHSSALGTEETPSASISCAQHEAGRTPTHLGSVAQSYLTSTQVSSRPPLASLNGHDDPISPIPKCLQSSAPVNTDIVLQQGDVHPQLVHDRADDQPSQVPHSSGDYRHPMDLADNRRRLWPLSRALNDQVPQLATIYTAVRNTGVPNSLGARCVIPSRLKASNWEQLATGHPNDVIVLDGVRYDFPSQYWGPPRPSTPSGYNHTSADS